MRTRIVFITAVIGLTLGGCTAATKTAHPTTTTFGGAPSGQSTRVKVDGQHLTIDVFDFIDPAKDVGGYNTDSRGADVQNKDHFATAKLQVINEGNSTIASGSLSVVAYDQNGTAYSSVAYDNNIVGDAYQNLQCSSGSALIGNPDLRSLSPSEGFTYCLAFILPEPDTVSSIEVSAIVGNGTGYNSWPITDQFLGWKS